jgi:Spy/CpxP family protein refolding chaperone
MFGMFVGVGLMVIGGAAFLCHRKGMHRVMFGCAMKRLKATQEQKQRLSDLFDSTHSRMHVTHERADGLRQEIADLLAAPEVDAKQVETLEAHLFEVVAEGSQILRDGLTQVRQILDVKQRQQLAEWVRKSHDCHGRRLHCHC